MSRQSGTGRGRVMRTEEGNPGNGVPQSPPYSHVEKEMEREEDDEHEAVQKRVGAENHDDWDGVEACAPTR